MVLKALQMEHGMCPYATTASSKSNLNMNGRAAGLVSVVSGISNQSEVGYPDITAGMVLNPD